MWYSATAAATALLHEQHLLIGGLGGVIAVIVGGIVSVITMRNVKRGSTPPVARPQPAPTSRRHTTPPTYAAPAPPTSPARRLHRGPISLSAPTQPAPEGDDDAHHSGIATSLFDPDILSARTSEPGATVPLLRSASDLRADWRAQSAPAPARLSAPGLGHAPIWNRSPFGPPEPLVAARETSAISHTSAPPIWRSMYTGAPAEPTQPDAEALASFALPAPIWDSWLSAPKTPDAPDAPDAPQRSQAPEDDSAEHAAPIWPSYLNEK